MTFFRFGELTCVQIKREDPLCDEQYTDIAELIYETDDYIYPALFGDGIEGRKNASVILPAVFEADRDSMFAKRNLFVAQYGEAIVGLILWHRGVLDWSAKWILDCANQNNISLCDSDVEKVQQEYIAERYSGDEINKNDPVSILNVCVKKAYRRNGVANQMLMSFLDEHRREEMELAVLADNRPAIMLYQKHGFRIINEVDGFSRYPEKPKCLIMTRPIPLA